MTAPHPDWLLSCEPREAQLEALRRSWWGLCTRDSLDGPEIRRPVPGHTGEPRRGWGHFMEMRVGKTPTHLNEGMLLRRDYGVKWHVVLSPNAFKEDWPLEAEKFGYDAPAIVFDSTRSDYTSKFIAKNRSTGGLIAVNYEALKYKKNIAVLKEAIGTNTLIGADESISLANPDSLQSKAALDLAKDCGWRRDLSGKPVSQGPHDLYAQLRFIGEQNGVMAAAFRRKFCQIGGFQGRIVTGAREDTADELTAILERCSFNARKIDWLKTPGKDYAPLRHIKMLPEQQAIYDRMEKEFIVELSDGTIVAADQIITKLLKLSQISSGYIIDEDGRTHWLVPHDKNPKIQELRHMLREEIGTKAILVCNSVAMMDALGDTLTEYRPAFIRGQIWHNKNGRDLVAEKNRFNEDSACRVLIGQEVSLKYGHTLVGTHSDPCHTTIFVENSYSLNDRSQCEERNQGATQTAPITIFDFITSPIMTKAIEALQRKEDVASSVLGYARDTGILPRR